MISLIVATRRKSSLSREAHSERWRDGHGELVKRVPEFLRHVRRYSQFHVIRDSAQAWPDESGEDYDGVSVLSFDDAAAMRRAFSEPRYLNEIRPDDEDITDFSKSMAFLVNTYPMYESVPEKIGRNIFLIALTKRLHSLSHDEYCRYWKDKHAPLALNTKDFVRHIGHYIQHHIVADKELDIHVGPTNRDYDGVGMVSFSGLQEIQSAFQEPAYLNVLMPDEALFDSGSALVILAREHRIFDAVSKERDTRL